MSGSRGLVGFYVQLGFEALRALRSGGLFS